MAVQQLNAPRSSSRTTPTTSSCSRARTTASGYLRAAMKRFERVALQSTTPARATASAVWRATGSKYLDKSSLDHAIRELVAAVRADNARGRLAHALEPAHREGRQHARAARVRGRAGGARRPDARIAHAAGFQAHGSPEDADAEFRAALPMLERRVRERFDDFAPLASQRDTRRSTTIFRRATSARVRAPLLDRARSRPRDAVQRGAARVLGARHAGVFPHDTKHHEWDERGELYARYGPPETVDYNPLGTNLFAARPARRCSSR